MIFVLLFFVLLMTVMYSWISLIKDSKSIKFRGPFPIPIIGNGHLFLGDSTKFLKLLQKLKDKYGSVSRFYILSNRYILLSNPKYIESVVSSTELINKGRSYDFLHPWLGQGLLTATGSRWKTHRKFLTPAFHFNILQNFLPVFLKNEKILVEKLRKLADGRAIDLFPMIALAALDNVTESVMGVSVNAQLDSESEYVKSIEKLSAVLSTRMRNPFAAVDAIFNLLPEKKIQDEALKILHGQTKKVIEARRRELKNINVTSLKYDSDHGIKNKHAFLDLLLLAEINGNKIDDESIREEVDTFMFEGHDTTTSGIVFTLFCIANHLEIQEKVLEEQRTILGSNIDRDPTYGEIQQMKYLELVIKESLRLYPSVPLIERSITKDTDIGGLLVPKDSAVLIDIMHMQRDHEYFENPSRFYPERFETKQQTKNPFNWLVFSAGPRNCIGQKFAMLEMKVTISAVVNKFKIISSGIEPELGADLILRSRNGVFIKFYPREKIHVPL